MLLRAEVAGLVVVFKSGGLRTGLVYALDDTVGILHGQLLGIWVFFIELLIFYTILPYPIEQIKQSTLLVFEINIKIFCRFQLHTAE